MDMAKLRGSDDKKEDEVVLPGFRFHPTGEELAGLYLGPKVEKKPPRFELMEQIDIYKYDPWDLPMGENNFEDGPLKRFHDVISLKSSDNLVLKMDKMAATSESEVLKGVIECTGGRDEIPVLLVSGRVLKQVVDFCEMQIGYNEILKTIKDRYERWIRGFVETNQEILFDLNHAADYLIVPRLLDLASKAMEATKEKDPVEVDKSPGMVPSPWAFA